MAGQKIEKIAESFLLPIVKEHNFELVDVEFVKEGPNWYLRAFIDKENGITIDDCELVSRSLEQKLDAEDPISQPYILEVSSPGLDRPLKKDADFERFKGEVVDIKLYKPQNKKKEFQGILQGLVNNVVTIVDDNENEIVFQREEIASIRLAVIF